MILSVTAPAGAVDTVSAATPGQATDSVPVTAKAGPNSTFDTGRAGWTVVGDAQSGSLNPDYVQSGGNPGGHICAADDAAGGVWYFAAPNEFLGDKSGYYNGTLRFDLNQSSTDSPFDDADVVLSDLNRTVVYDFGGSASHPETNWTSYAVPLNASGNWTYESGANVSKSGFEAVLTNLSRMRIRGEYRVGYDRGCLDNVAVTYRGDLKVVTDRIAPAEVGRSITRRVETLGGTEPVDSFTVVTGSLPSGLTLHDNGVLNGTVTSAGTYNFTIEATDADGDTARQSYTMAVPTTTPRAGIEIEKVSGPAVPGRKQLYVLRVANRGETVARNVSVKEFLQPWFTYTAASPSPSRITSDVVLGGNRDNWPRNATKQTLHWEIDRLPPGESKIVTYQVLLAQGAPSNFVVSGEACSCSGPCCDEYYECKQKRIEGCEIPGDIMKGSTAYDCLTGDIPGCLYGLFGPDPEQICNDLGETAICQRTWRSCRAAEGRDPTVDPPSCDEAETNVTTATDPNEKVVAADKYVRPSEELPYTVYFENVGNATATNVTVVDELPPALSLSSVEVFTANRSREALAPGETVTLLRRNFTRTRTVTVGNRTITRNETVERHYTATLSGRTLRWHLENIDLAPNETGTVLVSATPKRGLSNGTRIENNATIEFDQVSSLTTNDTVNVIDRVPPSCRVLPLPSRSSGSINLSWTGTDSVGRIESVTLFVSSDGGQTWTVAASGVEARTTTYDAALGDSYQFACVARDTAGNRETEDPTAEARTHVPAFELLGTVSEPDGTAVSTGTITLGDASEAGYAGTVPDTDGIALCGLGDLERTNVATGGQFGLLTEAGVRKNVAYYQADPGHFLRAAESATASTTAFPTDGTPDLYAVDQLTLSQDRDLGTVDLPPASVLNVTVVTQNGTAVENATVAFEHVGNGGARASIIFPNATDGAGRVVPRGSDGPGLEVTDNVTVTVLPPSNATAFVQQSYTRNLTVSSDRNVTITVETPGDSGDDQSDSDDVSLIDPVLDPPLTIPDWLSSLLRLLRLLGML
jgi:uncharacterized repeat protein (TIGR01451 family)